MPTIKMIITLPSSLKIKEKTQQATPARTDSFPPPPQYLSSSVTLIMHLAPHDWSIKIFNHLASPRTVHSNEAMLELYDCRFGSAAVGNLLKKEGKVEVSPRK